MHGSMNIKFQTDVEKVETHILCSIEDFLFFCFRRWCRIWDNVE